MIFVNFKTYKESTGDRALFLAKVVCDVATEKGLNIISCPQAVDIKDVVAASDKPVCAQHVDAVERGRSTGWLSPEVLKEIGVDGVLLNHSEHKLSLGDLGETMARCKNFKLKMLVFANTLEEVKLVVKFKPDWVGYEPPELIGSRTTSVAQAKPDIVAKAAEICNQSNLPLIVGAGIHSQEDVRKSIELGAVGVGLATDVVKAEDPKKELLDLADGFK
jgi:triosephosphate isomerase